MNICNMYSVYWSWSWHCHLVFWAFIRCHYFDCFVQPRFWWESSNERASERAIRTTMAETHAQMCNIHLWNHSPKIMESSNASMFVLHSQQIFHASKFKFENYELIDSNTPDKDNTDGCRFSEWNQELNRFLLFEKKCFSHTSTRESMKKKSCLTFDAISDRRINKVHKHQIVCLQIPFQYIYTWKIQP